MNRGLTTLLDLKDRCWVDDITGCWHWRYGLTVQKYPSIWFAPLQMRTTPNVILCWLKTGQRPPKGEYWHRTCQSIDCCNPDHRIHGTRKSQMRNAAVSRTPIERARIANTKRQSSKLSEADVEEIRNSSDRLIDCATRHGISIAHVSRIRRGEVRRQLMLGASVFSLGASVC